MSKPVKQVDGPTNEVEIKGQVQTKEAAQEHIQWVYVNGLGERDPTKIFQADVISAIKFDKSGDFIAVGDEGGRVVIFQKSEISKSRYSEYRYHTEVQSHEFDFDQLKSEVVGERISQLSFLNQSSKQRLQFLASNQASIKLWKVEDSKKNNIQPPRLAGYNQL